MTRSGIDVTINPPDRYILFRMRGVVSRQHILDATARAYDGLEQPWLYNRIYDVRKLINIISLEVLTEVINQWDEIVGRRHAPMRFAFVTDDPVRLARGDAYKELFPHIDYASFPSLEAAEAWLKTGPSFEDAPVKTVSART